jgi:hypothetical protein
MPISESLIPKEARKITLRVIIMVLDSFEGALDNPSLITLMMYLLSRTNVSGNLRLTIANIPTADMRLAITKEKRIPKAPKSIDSIM